MYTNLNDILFYLKNHHAKEFKSRTKFELRLQLHCSSDKLDRYLSQLSKDGYINSYHHPQMELVDSIPLEKDEKIYFSLSNRGEKFLSKGGYNI